MKMSPAPNATASLCATPARSPRFHGSNWPTGIRINSGMNKGTKVRLKNGGPTEIFSPVMASSASG